MVKNGIKWLVLAMVCFICFIAYPFTLQAQEIELCRNKTGVYHFATATELQKGQCNGGVPFTGVNQIINVPLPPSLDPQAIINDNPHITSYTAYFTGGCETGTAGTPYFGGQTLRVLSPQISIKVIGPVRIKVSYSLFGYSTMKEHDGVNVWVSTSSFLNGLNSFAGSALPPQGVFYIAQGGGPGGGSWIGSSEAIDVLDPTALGDTITFQVVISYGGGSQSWGCTMPKNPYIQSFMKVEIESLPF